MGGCEPQDAAFAMHHHQLSSAEFDAGKPSWQRSQKSFEALQNEKFDHQKKAIKRKYQHVRERLKDF